MKEKKRKLVNIVDLEACCWRGHPPKGQSNEIIEIGIVSVDYVTKEIIDSRSIIVKPTKSEISKFCTELTTIDDELVKKEGISFARACNILRTEFNSEKRMWMSWGQYDKNAMRIESKKKRVKYPFGKSYINLKELFALKYGMIQSPGVLNALKYLDLEFEGVQHRAINDSINTARILKAMCE